MTNFTKTDFPFFSSLAEVDIREMISNHPLYHRGREKFVTGDYTGALADYTEAIKGEENPSLYSERAVTLFHLGELQRSLDDMNYAAEMEPENPYRYSSRAYVRDAMGDTEGAIEDYERAVALDPEDAIAHNNLGLLQEKLGYKDQAQRTFQQADNLADELGMFPPKRPPHEMEIDEVITSKIESKEIEFTKWQFLKRIFTTKSGFAEYLKFIRNGFRV